LDTVNLVWEKIYIAPLIEDLVPPARDECLVNVAGKTIFFAQGFRSGPLEDFWKIEMSEELYQAFQLPLLVPD